MRKHFSFPAGIPYLKEKLLSLSARFGTCCLLDSSTEKQHTPHNLSPASSFDFIFAAGAVSEIKPPIGKAFDALLEYLEKTPGWIFGFLGYDLKNETENLVSSNHDFVGMPPMHFFSPRFLFIKKDNILTVSCEAQDEQELSILWDDLQTAVPAVKDSTIATLVQCRISKEAYLQNVQKILSHIRQGDIYELNYCQEFYAKDICIDPVDTYLHLLSISAMPFSCYYQQEEKMLMSASPERFLKKEGTRIISQPIKGTARRGSTAEEDRMFATRLLQDDKERAENVMIVDLVRNDLSKIAEKESVIVEELYGIYTFPQVHQMISTVSARAKKEIHPAGILKALFPMGSMTGAPKVKAMELIEKYEVTRRGLFSGAVGYFTPDRDFDFNVVIRSLLYNAATRYLSFMTGSAITAHADPEKEYEECLLKAKAIRQVLEKIYV